VCGRRRPSLKAPALALLTFSLGMAIPCAAAAAPTISWQGSIKLTDVYLR